MRDGSGVEELRLWLQPIIRYKAADRGVVDGAIFALVWKGTDPEILLILEDRKDDSDARWQFAPARFNFLEIQVKRNGCEIWRVGVVLKNDVYITGVVGDTTLDDMRATARQSDNPASSAPPN